MKRYIVVLLLFLPLINYSQVYDTLKINKLGQRIERLEGFENVLEERVQNKISLLEEKSEIEIIRAKEEIKDEIRPIKYAVGFVTFLALLAVGAFLYQLFWGVKRIADRQMKRNLQNHLKSNADVILNLIKSQQAENDIKRKMKITTLNPTENDATILEKILTKMGFINISSLDMKKCEDNTESDLIIFNDRDCNFDHQLIHDYLRQSKEVDLFIYFGSARLELPNDLGEHRDKLNFANKSFTLYHQIIQTLTYKQLYDRLDNN